MNRPQRNNDGVLFQNDQRQSERSPDYSGSITVDGKPYWLSAWKKSSRDGKEYLSLAAKPKLARDLGAGPNPPDPRLSTPQQQARDADLNDDLPF